METGLLEADKPATEPETANYKTKSQQENFSISNTIETYKDIMSQDDMKAIIPWMIQSGFCQAVNAGMIYRFVVEVYEGKVVTESFKFAMICLVWVIFSSVMSASAQIFKKVDESQSKQLMKTMSVSLAVIYSAHMILAKFTSIWIVLVAVVVQAIASLCFDQLTSNYVSKRFPGRSEAFSIFKQFQNGVAALVLVAYITMPDGLFRLGNATGHVSLAVWLISVL